MARLIVVFIRHGEYQQPAGVPSAHLPYPLNPTGINQAREAAKSLIKSCNKEDWHIDPLIDSSRLLRGWQTASILASELEQYTASAVTVESFDQLAERSLGSAANLRVDEIESVVKNDPRYASLPAGWKSDSYFTVPFPGAESLMQAGERVMQHVTQAADRLRREISLDTVKIFVGHGAAFRHAAVHMGLLTPRQAVERSMFHCHPIFLQALEGNKWQHIGGEWKIRQAKDLDQD